VPKPAAARNPARTIGLVTVLLLMGAVTFIWISKRQPPVAFAPVVEPVNPEEIKAKADAGDAAAQFKLGSLYANGDGVKRDTRTAANYYRLAADQGNTAAQIALGELYETGLGVTRDEAEAVRWYRKAADQGSPAGQYALAVMYLMGTGVAQNDAEALKWYRASADQGYALALFHLGMRYKNGQGVTADPVEAYKWLSLAAERGVAEAIEIRAEVKTGMTRDQVAEAKRRADEFTAKLPVSPKP
jgi:hypothetical protein